MKRTVRVTAINRQQQEDLRSWLSQPVAARIAAVEALRQEHAMLMGEDAEQRLQRVCCVTRLRKRLSD